MSSNDIYPIIKPTYLYIKQHAITGLKYFGKTIKKDPIKYLGSGKYWQAHISSYGKQYVVTLWYQLFTDYKTLVDFAMSFSLQNNIVQSSEWANLVNENGTDGNNQPRTIETLEKIKLTNLQKYGFMNPFQVPEIKSKIEQKRFEQTGFYNPSQNPEIKKQKKQTCLQNYGVESGFQLIEQRKLSCLEKYGVEWATQSPSIKEKTIQTNLQKYGTENVLSKGSPAYNKKNKTVFEKYGVKCVLSLPEVREKRRQTILNSPNKICPYCQKSGKGGNFNRHHFSKCKLFKE